MKKILLADVLEPEGIEILQQAAQVDEKYGLDAAALRQVIGDYEAVLVRVNTKLDAETLACAKKLRVIGMPGVGLDHIDLDYAAAHGITVCNVPGGNMDAVAELTMTHILMLLRKAWAACDAVKREHSWNKYQFMGREVSGRRLGVIGLGRIGARVAQLAQAFNMEVCAYDPYVQPDRVPQGVRLLAWEELLAWGEVFTIHAPLTKDTYHLIDSQAIDSMQRHAYVINMSRGGLLDEDAVYAALCEGRLAGAAGDVMEKEPSPGQPIAHSPLFELPNFLVTPHISAWTVDTQVRVAKLVAEKMAAALADVSQEKAGENK